jgi:hypothetical protein
MLLRRFADQLDDMGIDNSAILHVVVGDEMSDYGTWWDITAYYDDSGSDPAEPSE